MGALFASKLASFASGKSTGVGCEDDDDNARGRRFWWLALMLVFGTALAFALRSGTPAALPLGTQADRIVVEKRAHTLTLFRHGQVLKSYWVALGRGGLEPKLQAGDSRVPEGVYRIVSRNAHSSFHRALRVGYPNLAEIDQARLRGVDPGDDIMVMESETV